ncbi:MAG TPA: uroporphyrinogen decarboxylase family protein [Planctomycetota bacterium]|nr:uroporphyrinogen decarboxylase family protein [Planctomycetota bacterium]
MNDRERYHATMHYLPRDRCPIMDFGFWAETLPVWEQQGYPAGANPDEFFGMDKQWIHCGANLGLLPLFESKVLEDQGETEIFQQADGVVVQRRKFMATIPHEIDHLLKGRESWDKLYKPRLRAQDPNRFPPADEWKRKIAEWTRPDRDYPLFLSAGSLYGHMRNWMGMVGISEVLYDDRKLFEEMVETQVDVVLTVIERVLAAGVRPEAASMWEDMCYNAGPLLSPKHFKEILVPQYKRITKMLNKYGVDIIFVDSDGDISKLAGLWMEAGVNTMFPIEVGTWKGDPVKYRKQYGKDMRIMGGFGKVMLAGSKDGIKREVARFAPMVEEGGFIPFCDHRVPPDVPLDNYLFYLDEAKRVWGKGLSNIKPTGKPVKVSSKPAAAAR